MGFGGLVLAAAPGKFFGHDAAGAAVHAPAAVEEENQKAPEGDELEAPLGEMIVTRRRLLASGAHRRRTLPRPHRDFDGLFVRAEAGVLINESSVVMAVV